jgi:hypothetical protein
MRESRTFGSVGGEGGNVLAYTATDAPVRGGLLRSSSTPVLPTRSE